MSNIEDDLKEKGFIEAYKQIKNNASIIKSIDKDFFFELVDYLLSEREQLLKEKKDDKQDIKDFQNALNEENLRCANYAIENNELKKRIKELEAKLEFKKYGDLDEIEFEEYMSHFIPKQKVKDYLKEEQERFEVYKKESETNENLKYGMWKHLGAKNMCEKILGIEKNIATLD